MKLNGREHLSPIYLHITYNGELHDLVKLKGRQYVYVTKP